MTAGLDENLLDDENMLETADPGGMLRQVASSAAQVRTAERAVAETDLGPITVQGRPRAILVTGMGGSGIAGDVLSAVCGPGCAVQVASVHDYSLPGWAGAADLVIAVSCSGSTEETLGVAHQAVRRGCRLAAVGAAGSPLADLAAQARAPFVPVVSAGMPRSTLWGLSIPLVGIAQQLGLAEIGPDTYEKTARLLEDVSHSCRPASESFVNPAKGLAAELAGCLPMIWGTSQLTGVVAYRFACQLNENAKQPALPGVLPEANHNQVVGLDGPFAALDAPLPLRLVMLTDTVEHPQVTRRREASVQLAADRGIGVTQIAAEGDHPLLRLASLMQLIDYATVYLALGSGIDPSPINVIQELKARIA
ncbi:MAG: bifunctional phosphoglucose/phosphomannose isomerase [Micromonosporaceae bacterium]